MFLLLLVIMRKTLISFLNILLIFWLQEGLLVALNLYLPLAASVIALIHLYRLPQRWWLTVFLGAIIEITSVGFSGKLIGLLVIGLICQTMYSFISHAHDRFYVVVVGALAVLIGEVASRLSVNLITDRLLGGTFEVQEWTVSSIVYLIIGAMAVLYFGKKIMQPNKRYV